MIFYLALGALVIVAMYAHAKWMNWRVRHLEKHRAAMEEFYSAANSLVKDKDSPIELLELLQFLNTKATTPASAREFLTYLVRKPKIIGANAHIEAIDEHLKIRPELRPVLSRACSTAFEALAYRSPFSGIFLRVFVLFDGREHAARTQELAENYCGVVFERSNPGGGAGPIRQRERVGAPAI